MLSPEEIVKAKVSGIIYAAKMYPAHATTNSQFGVTNIAALRPVFQAMSDCGLPLLVHGEVTDSKIDIFNREAVFIEQVLKPLISDFPTLRIVMEHITTSEAVDFILSCPDHICATITAHHLLYNRNDIFKSGVRPHMYCLPILKTEEDRLALLTAATSGNPKFFLGEVIKVSLYLDTLLRRFVISSSPSSPPTTLPSTLYLLSYTKYQYAS